MLAEHEFGSDKASDLVNSEPVAASEFSPVFKPLWLKHMEMLPVFAFRVHRAKNRNSLFYMQLLYSKALRRTKKMSFGA